MADPAPFTYLSLFSGYGGLDLAVRGVLPDARCLLFVEREAPAVAILAARMEDGGLDAAPVWSDVRTVPTGALRGRVGMVVGGFPCQDLSVAGKREGLEGARSGLWFEMLRVAEEVGAEWIFAENVRGIFSADGAEGEGDEGGVDEWAADAPRAIGTVLGSLADGGWDAEWLCLTAASVGAPHRRERWFLLAHRAGEGREGGGPDAHEGRPGSVEGRDGVAHAEASREGLGLREPAQAGGGAEPGAVGRGEPLADPDLPGREGRGGSLGCGADELPLWPPGPSDREGWAWVLARWPGLAPAPADTEGRDGLRPASRRTRHAPLPSEGDRAEEAPEPGLRGLADGALPRVDRLRAAGNGVVPAQAEAALRELFRRFDDVNKEK